MSRRTYTISLRETRPGEVGHGRQRMNSDNVIRTRSRHQGNRITRFGIGYVAPDETARRAFGGPELPGPWPYLYALPGVIDCHGGSAAESARLTEAGIEFAAETGDRFIIDGRTYELRDDRALQNPYLELIEDAHPEAADPGAIARGVERAQRAALAALAEQARELAAMIEDAAGGSRLGTEAVQSAFDIAKALAMSPARDA